MRIYATILSALCVAGCGDTVTDRYPTRAEAEADRLFERGWLPEIIPNSSSQIVTRNNLDLNTSRGSFEFDPKEFRSFAAQLERRPDLDSEDRAAYRYRGWRFMIDETKARCEYRYSPR